MLKIITILSIIANSYCYNIPFLNDRPKKFLFKFDFPDVSISDGMKHIHFPEHIKQAHKYGAPFFDINKVYEPEKKQICFDCETLGRKFKVTQYSNYKYDSTLVFRIQNSTDINPFLKLKFIVKPYNNENSHVLYINFIFWNSLYYAFCPLLPIFVLTNSLEDKYFFTNDHHKSIIENENFIKYREEVMK